MTETIGTRELIVLDTGEEIVRGTYHKAFDKIWTRIEPGRTKPRRGVVFEFHESDAGCARRLGCFLGRLLREVRLSVLSR